ncbi:MAG: methyl-accepting chemotaxis protein [Candidatus Margulisbacteria bacterium]|nr:methyl-accepting chemotaxis protein [Candidatus Margulisiibacteriota bacterium]
MNIKFKLNLYTLAFFAIILIISFSSILGMWFVKSKLYYLTSKSTPYQVKTVEFQKALQQSTAELIKVSTLKNSAEFTKAKNDAQDALNEVKKTQDALKDLSGAYSSQTYEELLKVSGELFEITQERLKAEAESKEAKNNITEKLNMVTVKLLNLESRIRNLQTGFSASYTTSLKDTDAISVRINDVRLLKEKVLNIQLGIFEIQKAMDKKSLLIIRSKINMAVNDALKNGTLCEERGNQKLCDDVKSIAGKIDDLIKQKTILISATENSDTTRYDSVNKDLGELISVLMMDIENQMSTNNDSYNAEVSRQSNIFSKTNIATNILMNNSEFTAIGLSVKAISNELFTISAVSDLNATKKDLENIFDNAVRVSQKLERGFNSVNANSELVTLREVSGAISSVKDLLFSGQGIINKLENNLLIQDKAARINEKLRQIVKQQTEKGKVTISTAQVEQNQTIKNVNSFVRLLILLLFIICFFAVLIGLVFGMILKKAIIAPLAELSDMVQQVEETGDYSLRTEVIQKDEVGLTILAFNSLLDSLQSAMRDINTVMAELARGNFTMHIQTDLKGDLNDMKENTNKSVEDLKITMQQISGAIKEMSDALNSAMEHIQYASQRAQESSVMVEGSQSHIKKLKEVMSDISASSNKINKITAVITEIANKTNLLSLNAAVEAARAGEHGKGFAVVADEVRSLARHSGESAKDILDLVEEAVKNINFGVNTSNEISEQMDKVVFAVKETDSMLQQLAASMEEQNGGIRAINDQVQRFRV